MSGWFLDTGAGDWVPGKHGEEAGSSTLASEFGLGLCEGELCHPRLLLSRAAVGKGGGRVGGRDVS